MGFIGGLLINRIGYGQKTIAGIEQTYPTLHDSGSKP